jgi:hypothetical protein
VRRWADRPFRNCARAGDQERCGDPTRHPPRIQALPRKGLVVADAAEVALDGRLNAVHAVGIQRGLRFTAKIDQIRCGALHAEGELVTVDAGSDLGITDVLVLKAVEIIQGANARGLHLWRDACGIAQVQNRRSTIAKHHSRIR